MIHLLWLLIYLLVLSVLVERLIEMVKLVLPRRQWVNQKHWKLFIGILALIFGFSISYLIDPVRFIEYLGKTTDDRLLLALISGVSVSGGSKIWRDLLVQSK